MIMTLVPSFPQISYSNPDLTQKTKEQRAWLFLCVGNLVLVCTRALVNALILLGF